MPYDPGLEENGFLNMLQVKPHNLEFLADECTKVRSNFLNKKSFTHTYYKIHVIFQIYVWHTRSQAPNYNWLEKISNKTFQETNLGQLRKYWENND